MSLKCRSLKISPANESPEKEMSNKRQHPHIQSTSTDIVYICLIYVTSGISSLYKNAQRPSELSKYVRSFNMN